MDLVHLTGCRRRRSETGASALLSALFATVMFGLAALVVDLGHVRVVRGEAQAASDSSALAAGNALYLSGTKVPDIPAAVTAAKTYAQQNYGITEAEWSSCEDPSALAYAPAATECISFDEAPQPTKIRVVVPMRQVVLVFGPLFGVDEVPVAALAEASIRVDGKSNCGLCVVGYGYHDFQNGDAYVSGGDVYVNGSVNIQNNGLVSTDGDIYVEGTASGPLEGYTPDPITGQPAIDDPLANYPLPPSYTGLSAKTDPCADGPGYYGAFNFPNATCRLDPGLYVVTGRWAVGGNEDTVLDATSGVTLYFTCGTTSAPTPCTAPGQEGGWLDAAGNGNVSVTAPSTGATAGMAIAYDRLNTSDLQISGTGTGRFIGTIYALSSTMRYDGGGCANTNESLIITGNLEFNGSPACLNTDYIQEKNVQIPPGDLHLTK